MAAHIVHKTGSHQFQCQQRPDTTFSFPWSPISDLDLNKMASEQILNVVQSALLRLMPIFKPNYVSAFPCSIYILGYNVFIII